MMIVVCVVSAMVHVYSIGYMQPRSVRAAFHGVSQLFTFMMLMLVTADNLVQMFFGWEGVGLALSADRFLVQETEAQCGGDQGVCRQPGRRLRLRAGYFRTFLAVRHVQLETIFRAGAGSSGAPDARSSAIECHA